MRKTIRTWAVIGIVIPIAVLLDLNLLGGVLFDYAPFLLLLWPSSFMLSGFSSVSLSAIVGLLVSIALNVILYALVGVGLARVYAVLTARR